MTEKAPISSQMIWGPSLSDDLFGQILAHSRGDIELDNLHNSTRSYSLFPQWHARQNLLANPASAGKRNSQRRRRRRQRRERVLPTQTTLAYFLLSYPSMIASTDCLGKRRQTLLRVCQSVRPPIRKFFLSRERFRCLDESAVILKIAGMAKPDFKNTTRIKKALH